MEAFAKFLAVGSFLVRSRNLYMIVGDVVDGEVEPGMLVRIDLNPLLGIEASIREVEVAEVAHEGTRYLGLVMDCETPEELEILAALGVGGETLELYRKPRPKG